MNAADRSPAANIEDICELTPMQRGLMFHSLYDPESTAYLEQVVCSLRGNLDQDRLRRAFEMVLERHGVLRSSFHWRGLSKPLQIVMKQVELPWQNHDWRSLQEAERQQRANDLIAADRSLTFKLDTAPIMRCSLLRLSDDRCDLLWTFHHLLLDGWSMPIVVKDLFEYYEALMDGRDAALPPVRPYRDYMLWRQSQNDPESPAFWRGYLAGITSPARITSNSAAASPYGESSRQLPDSTAGRLCDFARVHRLTPYTVIAGALAFVIARWSSQPEVIFGSVVNGRPAELKNAEAMVGLFINVIPVRVSMDFSDTVLSWLSRLQEQQLESSRHSQESLVDLQGWSEVARPAQLFELLLAFANYPTPGCRGAGHVQVTGLRMLERTTYPLTLTVIPNDPFAFRLVWDEGRFETAMAHGFLDHLCDVVTAIVSGSARLVGELPREVNGTADLQKLSRAGESAPAPAMVDETGDRQLRATMERDLREIWSEVLGVTPVGRTDNFFELGGHSLNAISVISRVHERLGVDLPLRRLFESPTIAQLAVELTSAARSGQSGPNGSVTALPRRRRAIPCKDTQ